MNSIIIIWELSSNLIYLFKEKSMDTTGTTTPTDQNEIIINQLTVPWRNTKEIENRKKSLNDILIGIGQNNEDKGNESMEMISPDGIEFFK